jgi:hypothetical protein
MVMFEPNAHSIPAWAADVEEMVFVPAPTSVTELPEIITAAVLDMLMS